MAAEQTATVTQECLKCGAVIDTTNAEPLSRVECPSCGEKVRVERSFNNFVLLETLGIGGMGTVYKARDTLLERDVALKLLRTDLGGEIDQTKRLQQEARVAASINHPNVIGVFSSGIDHGQFYLVMELVDKGSLDDKIEELKRIPEELVLETGIQAAKGLRAAYAKGLIHRDVKPANILFSDDHTAKIGDFGLAGVAAEEAENRGEIWGTPYYVAPERLKNEPEDFRSDIYSLGATLFHALAGTAPIEGETNSAAALHELKTRPIDLRKMVPNVSADTMAVFKKMISPDPAQRFSSYDEVVSALEHAYGTLTGSGEFVGRKRRRRLLIGLGVLFLALIGVGSWALISHQRAGSTLKTVKAQAELAPLQGRLTEAQRELSQVRYVNDYTKPKEAFARIAADAQKKQPIYDWARLQQGIAAMTGNETSQAQQAFHEVENAGEAGFAPEDAGFAKFFVSTANKLSSRGKVPADTNLDPTNHEAFAIFAFALKDVSEADAVNATALLEKFLKAQPTGNFAWIADYKPLAQKYLDDCKLYLDWKKEGDEAKDATALNRHLENTKSITSKRRFKMHSALSDQVYEAKNSLPRQMADQQKTETTNREQEKKQQAEQTAKLITQKKPQWLADWKKKLVADLNRAHFSGAVTDVNGLQYTGILSANQDTVTMQNPYGVVPLAWAKLTPKTLLDVSTSFIKPNAPDAAERQWLCAVFANETKQADAAKKLADEAVKSKPEYRDQASALLPK